MSRTGELAVAAVAVLLILTAPALSPLAHVDISIVSQVLLFALAAMSVNLLLGYTGLPAFGNAAFFGLGAYGAALSVEYWHVRFIEATVLGTLLAVIGAVLIGPFLLRRRGIYFGLLAIAFGEVFYFIAYRMTGLTNGEDGMRVERPPVVLGPAHASLDDQSLYYVAAAVFLVALFAFRVLVRSPFGRTLVAIRQNEARVRYLGLNTNRFVYVALVVSALIAGIGGALYSLTINFAYPLMLDWHQSGDFVLMMILGGAGTLWGPLIGGLIYVIGRDIISTITPLWQVFLGALFVACVLGFPRGIIGTLAVLRRRDA